LLPRINRAQRALELRHVTDLGADLVPGVWGIREPAEHCPIISVSKVEFMLVPGVAFTASGARLGYGGGYYDRLLTSLDRRAVRIAAAFELQMVDFLPEGPQDQRVDHVVTPT
jgi:5-formyltetrahydrofolate cyclo-ligase